MLIDIPGTEGVDVCVSDVRPQSLEVDQLARAATGDEREILARGGSDVWVVAGMSEVEVPVDKDQPVATAAAKRDHGAEQDAAIAAEHDREAATIERGDDTIGQAPRVARDRLSIADCQPIPFRPVPWWDDDPSVAGRDACRQPVLAQRSGQLVYTGNG